MAEQKQKTGKKSKKKNQVTIEEKYTLNPEVWGFHMNTERHVRPYVVSDFVPEYFFPDLSLAIPLAVGAAIKITPMIQQMLIMHGHCM